MSPQAQIEQQFGVLSLDQQFDMLQELVQHVRSNASKIQSSWESDLIAMAADPEIQTELRKIDAEFRSTELDGLENL